MQYPVFLPALKILKKQMEIGSFSTYTVIYKTLNGDCIFERQALCAQRDAVTPLWIVGFDFGWSSINKRLLNSISMFSGRAKIVVKIRQFRVQAGGNMQRTKIMPHLCAL